METFICQTCNMALPGKAALSPLVLRCFLTVNKVHQLWRWHRKISQVWANADNFKKLIAGHIVRWVIGDRLIIRIAAQAVLIARRMLDCAYQQASFCYAYRRWVEAIRGDIHIRTATPAMKKLTSTIFSPSTVRRFRQPLNALTARIDHIAKNTWNLLKEMFILSMRYLDVIEAFSLSTAACDESINELFLNATHLLNELMGNRDLLVEELERYDSVIEKILNKLGSSYHAKDLRAAIAATLEKTNNIYNGIKKIPKRVEWGLKDGVHSFLYAATGWAPQILLPKEYL